MLSMWLSCARVSLFTNSAILQFIPFAHIPTRHLSHMPSLLSPSHVAFSDNSFPQHVLLPAVPYSTSKSLMHTSTLAGEYCSLRLSSPPNNISTFYNPLTSPSISPCLENTVAKYLTHFHFLSKIILSLFPKFGLSFFLGLRHFHPLLSEVLLHLLRAT